MKSPKRASKAFEAMMSMFISLLVLVYIASYFVDINVWFITDLSIVQFVILIIGLNIVTHGLKKIIRAFDDKPEAHNKYDEWQKWSHTNTDSHHATNYNSPPPPPPPSYFNDYNSSYDAEHQKDGSSNGDLKNEYKQYKEDYKYYKQQYKDYKKEQRKDKDKTYEFKYKYEYTFPNDSFEESPNSGNQHENSQYRKDYYSNSSNYAQETIKHSTFIGDFKFKDSYWQLRPMELSSFIGDAQIDLTRAEIPIGETTIRMSAFIGDMKVHVPNDPRIGVKLKLNAFIGDSRLYDDKRGGFGVNHTMETPHYYECERRIVVQLDSFIGDLKVKRVG